MVVLRPMVAALALSASMLSGGACSSADGERTSSASRELSAAALKELYRAEAASTRWVSPGSLACSPQPQVTMPERVEAALSVFVSAGGRLDGEFALRVRLAAEAGALDLVGLGRLPTVGIPDGPPIPGKYGPCLADLRVVNHAGDFELVATVDRGSGDGDVVAMSRCLFSDIDLNFTYRIERVKGDDPATRTCRRIPSSLGLCRPSCSDLG